MQIPRIDEGKLVKKTKGGPGALKELLISFKKFSFNGAAKLLVSKEGKDFEGYLFVKDGLPILALYREKGSGDFKTSNEAMKIVWKESAGKETVLEVRGNINVKKMQEELPHAAVDLMGQKSSAKKTRAGLRWGDSNATLEEKIAEEIHKWKKKGFDVEKVKEALNSDPDNTELILAKYTKAVLEMEKHRKLLMEMELGASKDEHEKIHDLMKMTSDLDTVDKVSRGIDEMRKSDAYPESGPKCPLCGQPLEDKTTCTTCGWSKGAPPVFEKSAPGELDKKARAIVGEVTPAMKEQTIKADTHSFSGFVVGDSNRFAHAAAQAVAKKQSTVYNPLFIHSGPGLGKTHLMQSIGNYVKENMPSKKVMYATTERFINEFIESTEKGKLQEFEERYRTVDYLLLDDIHFMANHETVQDELFNTFNKLITDKKQVVMSSDKPPHEIEGLKKRLISRFESGLITDIVPPRLETRIAILKKKAEGMEVKIDEKILRFIAANYKGNVRTLEGALTKLIAYHSLMHEEYSLDMARNILKADLVDEADKSPKKSREKEGSAPALPPDPPIPSRAEKKYEMKVSHSYIIEEERPVGCYELFSKKVSEEGYNGMVISRTNPSRLRGQHDLKDITIYWLTDRESSKEKTITPTLEKIIYRVDPIIRSSEPAILLIDGLDYLISENSFDPVLRFLRNIIDETSESKCTFTLSVTPETINEQDLKILEREMEIIRF